MDIVTAFSDDRSGNGETHFERIRRALTTLVLIVSTRFVTKYCICLIGEYFEWETLGKVRFCTLFYDRSAVLLQIVE